MQKNATASLQPPETQKPKSNCQSCRLKISAYVCPKCGNKVLNPEYRNKAETK
ncbi:MAG: hypothetical protein ACQCN5_01945 [Candidatus Bathyarchaeia archaeon]